MIRRVFCICGIAINVYNKQLISSFPIEYVDPIFVIFLLMQYAIIYTHTVYRLIAAVTITFNKRKCVAAK